MKVIQNLNLKYLCKKCKSFHYEQSMIGKQHKKYKKRINITAYRMKVGDFDKGSSLKEHYQIDKDRKPDWD
jgi:hypothetical protein